MILTVAASVIASINHHYCKVISRSSGVRFRRHRSSCRRRSVTLRSGSKKGVAPSQDLSLHKTRTQQRLVPDLNALLRQELRLSRR
jgi:hypothetical protein